MENTKMKSKYELNFKTKNSTPVFNNQSNQFLIVNKCEGYILVQGVFSEQGAFLCFDGWVAGEIQSYYPKDYELWAKLPNSIEIS